MRPINWCRKEIGMPVVPMREWDIPKDEERDEKHRKFEGEVMPWHASPGGGSCLAPVGELSADSPK